MKTRRDCREWRELLGAHALGRLKGDERAGLEAHLEGCAECRTELAALQPVTRMLPYADPERFESAPAPPADLGQRIAATIEVEKERLRRRRQRRRVGGVALGGAAAALAAAVLLLFVLSGEEASPERHVEFASLPPGVRIYATLAPHAYGTEIRMYVHGVESGTLCRVALRGPKGVTYPAGAFRYRWGDDSDAVLSSALDLSRTRALVVHAGRRTFIAPVNPRAAALNPGSEKATT
ncbi:MAG TPA: anti-sigma factor [Solirubrobacterales bacterium]|nr:anti-sigma factor [Solirubrobacterales bacterium]